MTDETESILISCNQCEGPCGEVLVICKPGYGYEITKRRTVKCAVCGERHTLKPGDLIKEH